MLKPRMIFMGLGASALALTSCYMAADGVDGEDDEILAGESWQALLRDGDTAQLVFPPPPGGSEEPARSCLNDCSSQPLAYWRFDDCTAESTQLLDYAYGSNIGHPAFRAVSAECSPGVGGLGVRLDGREDIVYAPDQPDFNFDQGLTIAAYVAPDGTRRTQSLVRKRLGDDSAFVLAIENRRLRFVLRLDDGRVVGVSAPISAGHFTHVAASYDGRRARLYLNGELAAEARARGKIARGAGPIFIGNDADGRRFEGVIDEVWLNTLAAPADALETLTCVRRPPLVSLTPAETPPLTAGDSASFELHIQNQNAPNCGDSEFSYSVLPPIGNTYPSGLVTIPEDGSVTIPFDVQTTRGTYAATYFIPAYVFDQAPYGGFGSAEASLVVGTGPFTCDGYPPYTPVIAGSPSSVTSFPVVYAAPGLAEPVVEAAYNADGTVQSLSVSATPGVPSDPVNVYFGVDLPTPCLDASSYDGIQFSIAGDVGTCTLRLELVTAEDNQVAFGGACTESVCYGPLSDPVGVGTWVVPFAALSGGVPVPSADPTAIQGVQWALDAPSDPASEPCSANFTISDVSFVNIP